MNTNAKRAAALDLLARTGIWRSNYEPPFLRLLWRFGINAPPPHFANFWCNAFIAGSYFAVAMGLFMWLVFWWRLGAVPFGPVLAAAAGAGLLFGFAMASYYAYGRHKHKLPSWRELRVLP